MIQNNLISLDELHRTKQFEEKMDIITQTVEILYSSLNEESSSWNTSGRLCRNFFGHGNCTNMNCNDSHSIEKALFKGILNGNDLKSALNPLHRAPNRLYSDYKFMENNNARYKQFEAEKKRWIEKERQEYIQQKNQRKGHK